jgi:plastocyanin
MRTTFAFYISPFFAALVLALTPQKSNGAVYFVDVFANGYSPAALRIAPGDSVIWINQDDLPHTVTSLNSLWAAGFLFDYNDTFGLTFNFPGVYAYEDSYFGLAGTITVESIPAPSNDVCSGAIAMTSGTTYTMDTSGATSAGDPTLACGSVLGSTVWYTFNSMAGGATTISTCGSDFDTVLSVYSGACGSLATVACNDDNGASCSSTAASLAFNAVAGTTYYVAVGGYEGVAGNLRIVMTRPTAGSWQEQVVPFAPGTSLARTDTNLVHLVDSTNDQLLTLDTDTGNFISSIRLLGRPQGLMCFSQNQQYLYVPLYSSQMLQIISVAELTTWDVVPLPVAPQTMAAGADGMLYVVVGGSLTKINPATGRNLGALTRSFYNPIIKANRSGTRLYIMELGLSGGGWMIDEYAVVDSALPTHVTSHYTTKSNDKDFVIAEDISTLYSTSGGVYGVGVWDMINRSYRFWPYESAYGAAVAMIPNDSYVYGASADYYNPRIRRFDRLTGIVANTYDLAARGYGAIQDRSLHVTPNNTIFYVRETRKMGLIGATALNTNLPVTAEVIYAGPDLTANAAQTLNLSALTPFTSGTDTIVWSKVSGPGLVTFSKPNSSITTVQMSAGGTYVLQVTRSNGQSSNHDRLTVTVPSTPIVIGSPAFTGDGRFQLQLQSEPGWYVIEASADLQTWAVLTNVFSPQGQITVTDSGPKLTSRFYRAQRATD